VNDSSPARGWAGERKGRAPTPRRHGGSGEILGRSADLAGDVFLPWQSAFVLAGDLAAPTVDARAVFNTSSIAHPRVARAIRGCFPGSRKERLNAGDARLSAFSSEGCGRAEFVLTGRC
jgi:hypothetical protein